MIKITFSTLSVLMLVGCAQPPQTADAKRDWWVCEKISESKQPYHPGRLLGEGGPHAYLLSFPKEKTASNEKGAVHEFMVKAELKKQGCFNSFQVPVPSSNVVRGQPTFERLSAE